MNPSPNGRHLEVVVDDNPFDIAPGSGEDLGPNRDRDFDETPAVDDAGSEPVDGAVFSGEHASEPDVEALAVQDVDSNPDIEAGAEGWRGDRDHVATVVDGVAAAGPVVEPDGLAPVVPLWLRSRTARRVALRRSAKRRWYVLRFHVVRVPAYWWRLAQRAPRGLGRVLVAWYRFSTDAEGRESINAIRSSAAPEARGDLARGEAEHAARWRARLIGDAIAVAVAVPLLLLAVFVVLPSWVIVAGLAITLAGLGTGGAPEHAQPIVERVMYKGQAIQAPSQNLVTRALADGIKAVGVALRDNPAAVAWRQPPTLLDTAAGYQMVVELPGGVTVEDAVKARRAIAGGLSRDVDCLAIEQVPTERGGHARMASLTVLDAPMRATPPAAWPLADAKARPVDVFDPVPLGVDLMGRPVSIDLMFRSAVVGAQPRVGKTFFVRLAVAAAALDPRAELHVFDLKGGVDFRAFGVGAEPGTGVIHSGVSSLRPELAGPALLETVQYLKASLRRRSDVLAGLPLDRCPEGKVTSELASERGLGLHPMFLIIDETQFAFDGGWGKNLTAELTAEITALAKAGPSFGICVWLSSQQVNETTIPRSISTMAGLRFCLSVSDHNEANQILGGGATARGFRPDHLTLDDKGIGYLSGEGTAPRLIRSFFLDGSTAAVVAARARHLREQAHRLTGHAAGETPEPDTAPSVLDDIATVWLVTDTGPATAVHLDTLTTLLSGQWPDRYRGWDARTLGRAVRAAGCSTGPVSGVHPDGTRTSGPQGIKHIELLSAIETTTITP